MSGVKRYPALAGALSGEIEGYRCPRCQKSFGCLFSSPSGYMYFCGEPSCLQDDSRASLAMKNNIAVQSEPTDAAIKFGIGKAYINASLSKWIAEPSQMDIIRTWVNNPKGFVALVGEPRTGKTYFCAAVANYFLEKKKQVKYLNCRRFYEEIQGAIRSDKSQYECIRNIAKNEILIIDDVAASTNSEWQKEVLLDLMDQRFSDEMPTIVTTNLTEKVFGEVVGARTASRVFSYVKMEVLKYEK